MNKITLKKININDKQICLNNGMNIVIGDNNSGKTLLFNLIQYVMGLKKQININADIKYIQNLYIDFEVCENNFRFEREINSNEINISGGINEIVKVGSNEYYEIYDKILEPSFNFGDDEIAAAEILKVSFLPQIKLSKNNIDIFKKVLGINTRYLNKSRKQIDVLKQEIINKESSYDLLKLYISNICKKINNHKDIEYETTEFIGKILNEEYMNLHEKSFEDKILINQSLDAYEKIKIYSDKIFLKKINELEAGFENLCCKLGITHKYKFIDILEGAKKLKIMSSSEDILIQIIVALILSVRNNIQGVNSTGILVSDSLFQWELDLKTMMEARNIIADECKNNKLQYIEFTADDRNIPTEWVVYDLNKGGRFSWL